VQQKVWLLRLRQKLRQLTKYLLSWPSSSFALSYEKLKNLVDLYPGQALHRRCTSPVTYRTQNHELTLQKKMESKSQTS
ncbi:MAG: hypothetical protein ABI337_09915, partial [Nitrososphaera sp.]